MHLRITASSYVLLGQAPSDSFELKWQNSEWTIYDLMMVELLELLQKCTDIISQDFLHFFSDSEDSDCIIFLMIFQYDF